MSISDTVGLKTTTANQFRASHLSTTGRRESRLQAVNSLDEHALTASHRSLPLGTVVRVKNKRDGREASVRTNDKGPFVRGRIIDLTPAAGKVLGFSGIADVSLAVANASSN